MAPKDILHKRLHMTVARSTQDDRGGTLLFRITLIKSGTLVQPFNWHKVWNSSYSFQQYLHYIFHARQGGRRKYRRSFPGRGNNFFSFPKRSGLHCNPPSVLFNAKWRLLSWRRAESVELIIHPILYGVWDEFMACTGTNLLLVLCSM
jgi:hypothetical protein